VKVVRTIRALREMNLPDVGFVPTMGALHEGHLSLMRRARELTGSVVVSIFVNPTQFGPREDFSAYPRDEEKDLDLAREIGVDVVFAPTSEEMYGPTSTWVEVEGLSDIWEGASRPGHFRGVATVVSKLFNIVKPGKAFFGLKDFQQCVVIRRMVEDLKMDVELHFEPTVREHDGLAMSSRNVYLSPEERRAAPTLCAALNDAATVLQSAVSEASLVEDVLGKSRQALVFRGFDVDYFELVDARTLEVVRALSVDAWLIAAARLGRTRLIDNRAVFDNSFF
jgi:pantoate--beta-alanine ligase